MVKLEPSPPAKELNLNSLVKRTALCEANPTPVTQAIASYVRQKIHRIGSFIRLSGAASVALVLLCILFASPISAQPKNNLALKTNILYDATTTPNLGIEFGVGNKNTFQLFYGLNPWTFDSKSGERKAKHWLLMPEYRWWTCSKFNGHFFGVHLMGGQFNASNVDLPLPGGFFGGDNIRKDVKDARYQAWYAGAGFTYGYQWILSRHWNLEAEIGVGYDHVWYDKYPCYQCGAKIKSGDSNYAGITKLGLSIMYIF